MRYELYYWAGIQGRGEFVRLALEEAGADYVDVAREAGGEGAMLRLLDGEEVEHPPFAPPYLRAGRLLVNTDLHRITLETMLDVFSAHCFKQLNTPPHIAIVERRC